jgi:GTP-binding protein LepA
MSSHLIRNFAIIAHIDHGKSTLADAIIKQCRPEFIANKNQPSLDNMEIEKERGITIKTQTVRLSYKYQGDTYTLNLLDTPGHVDFSYEVNRAMHSCNGSLLIVDGSQGVEAQTLSHLQKAMEQNHVIIPIITKMDMESAQGNLENVKKEIKDLLGSRSLEPLLVSARDMMNIDKILEAIINYIDPPFEEEDNRLKCLVVDGWYDEYVGEQLLLFVKSGSFNLDDNLANLNDKSVQVPIKKIHCFLPEKHYLEGASMGDLVVVTTFNKKISSRVGETLTLDQFKDMVEPIPGFKPVQHMVFCSFLPHDSTANENIRKSMQYLQLNDPSFLYEPEQILGLGMSFRCGFLGLLHMEIIKERLSREFNIEVDVMTPSVQYKITHNGDTIFSHSTINFPEVTKEYIIEEPWVQCDIFVKADFVSPVMEIILEKRGINKNMTYKGNTVHLEAHLPLNEVIIDFHDELQKKTSGFASFAYELLGYKVSELVKVVILVNKEPVPLLAFITHISNSEKKGKKICSILKEVLPKKQFGQSIQAAINGGTKIIGRDDISAYRKDVTAKCYGGHQERKDKLLDRQKEGKKKLKEIGLAKGIDISQKDLIRIFKME